MQITLAGFHTIMMRHAGPTTHILQIKEHLEKLGHEITLMDMWKTQREIFNTDLFHIHGSYIGSYDIASYLHSHGKRFVVTPIFFTRRSAFTVRTVCRATSFAKTISRGTWSGYSITQDICNWSQYVLPNTHDEARLIKDGLSITEKKITVIPNGVEKRFSESDPDIFYKKYGVKDFILNVGHIGVERKNTLSLIRALHKIDHPAVIIGRIFPSKEADMCIEEAKKNKNLTIIPGIDHNSPMLASAYAASNIFVLPAMYETPGIAALEAGLAGSRVVITPHGGTKDYFKDMATYVDPYSIKSIRIGVETALNQKPDDQLRNHIKNNFLWQKVAELTVDIYHQLLDL